MRNIDSQRTRKTEPTPHPELTRRFLAGEGGSVAIMLGVVISVLLGMVALGTEITFVLYKQRQMQAAADSAALGAATAITKGYPSDFRLEARAISAAASFVNGAGGVTVTVNNPPASGPSSSDATAVEVIISQPQTLRLVSLFTAAAFTITARAVAVRGAPAGQYCVLSTDSTSSTAVNISNGANVNLNQCGMAVNAAGSTALSVTGGARLTALAVSVVGQARVSNGGSISAANGVATNQAATADPYASVSAPAPAGCNYTNRSLGWAASTQNISPGTYCGGLTVGNGAQVAMAPGIYYMKSGSFNIGGGATVNGTGVTVVLTRNTGTYANVYISNGATMTLSAPTSGITAGLVYYGDRASPTSIVHQFVGGTANTYTGAVYFPTQQVVYSNGATNSAPCTQLIGWRIQFTGGISFNSNCNNTGTSPIGGGGSATALVE